MVNEPDAIWHDMTTQMRHLQTDSLARDEKMAAGRLVRQRGKAIRPPMAHLGDALHTVLGPVRRKMGGTLPVSTLRRQWPDMVGPKLSAISTPMRLVPGRPGKTSGATLVVRATSAAATLLQHLGPILIERVSLACGTRVDKLRLLQSPSAGAPGAHRNRPVPMRTVRGALRRTLARDLNCVKNEGVRDSLRILGEALMAREKDPDRPVPPPTGEK